MPAEPTVRQALEQGADLVTFSGDKLLGGPQAGIIVGSPALIEQINNNPLKRALRVDKMTLAALAAVLSLYRSPSLLPRSLPILRDLTRSKSEIQKVADIVFPAMSECLKGIGQVSLIETKSQIGSGALPVDRLDSLALAIEVDKPEEGRAIKLEELARKFRALPKPVVGRIHSGRLLFDLRCLQDTETFCLQLKNTKWN